MARGKIMRDTNAGPGIVSINGEQMQFTLETHWKSDSPPKVGGVVDVELDATGQVSSVTAVDDTTLAKEQANKAIGIASEKGKQAFGDLVKRVGAPTLAAVAALFIGWMFLSFLSIQISQGYKLGISFYDVLKMVNTGGNLNGVGSLKYSSAGFYGFLMYVSILAPLAPHFHKNKYLSLGYLAPLAYILIIALAVYWNIREQISQANGMASAFGGRQAAEMMSQIMSMTWQAVSLGLGFYLSLAVSIYLAVVGIKKYLVSTVNN